MKAWASALHCQELLVVRFMGEYPGRNEILNQNRYLDVIWAGLGL